jgi:uncharacterized damage-inducible protein DinB
MKNLQRIAVNLDRAQRLFLVSADSIEASDWRQRPGTDRWSAGEVVAHLIEVEKTILKNADKRLQEPPNPRSLLRRIHYPLFLVRARVLKRKTPIPLQPEAVAAKEEMLAELRSARERTRAFMEEIKTRDLSVYHMPHPFLGTLNLFEWLQMIASHQVRHTKQMREIATALQKDVANSH